MAIIQNSALDEILPFMLVVAADGRVLHLGRSIRKSLALDDEAQPDFFDIFEFEEPRALRGSKDLANACGKRVSFRAKRRGLDAKIIMRASVAQSNPDKDEFVVLMSLALHTPEIFDKLSLFDGDFSHADASVDLLYFLSSQGELLRDTQALADRLQTAKDLAEKQARTDTLTGLPNRRALMDYADRILSQDVRDQSSTYLLHLDLDRFKQVNDVLGHAAGDAILRRITADLQSVAAPEDCIARIGGDEFVWIATTCSSQQEMKALAADLVIRISTPLAFENQHAQVGASIGITSIHRGSNKSIDDYLLEADLALYEVKKSGRGAVKLFSGELQDRETIIQELIRDIEPAIAKGQFVPYFQIQVNTQDRTIFGAEVLGRWLHPKHGLISPVDFLFVAARAKLTEKIDLSIYEQALDHFASWKAKGIAPPHISLNLTEKMLTDSGFINWIVDAADSRGIEHCEVIFELLETILIDAEAQEICEAADNLARNGFQLAIDDFGTGRASLTSLISVPVNLIKIDRAFVTHIHQDEHRQILTEAIIGISDRLGLNLLAEGVEEKEECQVLQRLGCSVFQGYLFGRPVSVAEFTELLLDQHWQDVMSDDANSRLPAKSA